MCMPPNTPSKSFFQHLMSLLVPFIHLPLGGDFNQALKSQEEKSNYRRPLGLIPTNSLLSHFMDRLQLTDLWRLAHPYGK